MTAATHKLCYTSIVTIKAVMSQQMSGMHSVANGLHPYIMKSVLNYNTYT